MRVQIIPLCYSREEKGVFKKVMFCTKLGIFSEFPQKYLMFGEGTN